MMIDRRNRKSRHSELVDVIDVIVHWCFTALKIIMYFK